MKRYYATIRSNNTAHQWVSLKAKSLRGAKIEATKLLESSAYMGDEIRLVEVDNDEKRPLNDLSFWIKWVVPGKSKWRFIR